MTEFIVSYEQTKFHNNKNNNNNSIISNYLNKQRISNKDKKLATDNINNLSNN